MTDPVTEAARRCEMKDIAGREDDLARNIKRVAAAKPDYAQSLLDILNKDAFASMMGEV